MINIGLDDFKETHNLIGPYLLETSLQFIEDHDLWIKWENQQVTGSFKARGALNKVLRLTPELKERGIITASAGNHGQGVALAAAKTNTPVTVYTYAGAPEVKILAMRNLGAEVIVIDGTYRDAEITAQSIAARNGQIYVSPYNDLQVIVGQGTIALETCDQLKDQALPETPTKTVWYVPVSGGGLLAGIALAVRALDPDARVIGVQPENSAFLHGIFYHGSQNGVLAAPTIADSLDGAIDEESITIPLVLEYVDSIELVSENDMMDAIAYAWYHFNQKIEASGAVSIAAALKNTDPEAHKIAVVSGGNIQEELFQQIIQNYAD